MRAIDPGHSYLLDCLDGTGYEMLTFVKRLVVPGRTDAHAGTTCQEVLRVLIDRVRHLDGERRWEGNDRILHHLRMALVLFEARALERRMEKGEFRPECVEVDPCDGHFVLTEETE